MDILFFLKPFENLWARHCLKRNLELLKKHCMPLETQWINPYVQDKIFHIRKHAIDLGLDHTGFSTIKTYEQMHTAIDNLFRSL
jgi:hypothetical protein